MSNAHLRPSVVRVLALRFPLVAAVASALVIGPTVIVDASGDEAEPVATSMETLAVAGVSEEALKNTAGVGYNAPVVEPHPRTAARGAEPEHEQVEPDDDDLVAITQKRKTRSFSALGLTWESEQEPVTVWVRMKTTDEGWSDWEYVPSAEDHAPDPGASEINGARAGTAPLIVPESRGVQVRVEAEDRTAPRGMKVNLIDPKTAGQDAQLDQNSAPAGSAVAAGTQPEIITRAQWGADESIRRADPEYGSINGAFVHHTATTNDYTRSDVAADIRAIYTYHVKGRGWNDIGYNFLVDKFGRIFEGRYGGVGKPVIGAHTLGHNAESFAMSALGTYQSHEANDPVLDAYAKLFAWKLDLHGVDPTSMVTVGGHRLDAISGHRDAFATECPGGALYAQLPRIRKDTADLVANQEPPSANAARLGGANRYETAAKVSAGWPRGVDVVYIAGSQQFPDALVAAARSGVHDAPVLITGVKRLSDPVREELTRLRPGRAVVLGGAKRVSSSVLAEISSLTTTGDVERIAGANRYGTAAEVAQKYASGPSTVYLASGEQFPDALSIAALAGRQGNALLLTHKGSLPAQTRDALVRLKPGQVVVVGGTDAVSKNVVEAVRELTTSGTVSRWAGANRYGTAAEIAGRTPDSSGVWVASGQNFPDALVGAARAAQQGHPLVLTKASSVPNSTWDVVSERSSMVVLGGPTAVSDSTFDLLRSLLR